jgi:hypothetical protein
VAVLPKALVNSYCVIEDGCMVNSSAIIDHDTTDERVCARLRGARSSRADNRIPPKIEGGSRHRHRAQHLSINEQGESYGFFSEQRQTEAAHTSWARARRSSVWRRSSRSVASILTPSSLTTGQNYDYNHLNGVFFFRDLQLADPEVYMDAVGRNPRARRWATSSQELPT